MYPSTHLNKTWYILGWRKYLFWDEWGRFFFLQVLRHSYAIRHRANSRRPTSPDSTPRIKCTMMVDATRVGVLGPNCARHILLLATLHLLDKAWRKKRVSGCDLYLGLSLPHLSCHDMRCYEWDEMRTRHASKGKKKDKKKRGEPRTSVSWWSTLHTMTRLLWPQKKNGNKSCVWGQKSLARCC